MELTFTDSEYISLDDIYWFENLEKLTINGATLDSAYALTNLETLYLYNNDITDYSAVDHVEYVYY